MLNLLWFHAFERDSIDAIVGTLCDGPTPAPEEKSKSSKNESALGIGGPRVYAYLGHGTDAFGAAAFALGQKDVNGTVSPFDTGGLRTKIAPLQDWKDGEKKAYLAQYSWSTSTLPSLLSDYPSAEGLSAYLDGGRPSSAGPHDHWNGAREAKIWQHDDNSWQAWTWELRSTPALPAGRSIHRWSCSPSMYNEVQRFAENNLHQVAIFEFLFGRYVPGGVSGLVAALRTYQAEL